MSIAIQPHRLAAAHDAARRELLAARSADGHWIGELSSSPLSTATAAGALAVVARESGGAFDELIGRGIEWLLGCQAGDGGRGDTDKSRSNIATTMLVRAAFELSGAAARHPHAMRRADAYVESEGGVEGLRRRFGDDKTFATPILANCALSGLVPWSEVHPLPFEAACLPRAAFRHLGLPVVSYAIPALVAIGQARFFHRRPKNPITRLIRHLAVPGSLISENEALFSIADRSSALVELEISETYSGYLKQGQPVDLTIGSGELTGTIGSVGKVAVASSDGIGSTVTVKVIPDGSPETLVPGSTVVGELQIGTQENVLSLPRGSYLTTGSQKYLYVVEGDTAVKREVGFGTVQGNDIVLLRGVQAGEEVIISGYQNYIEYESVKLEKEN